MIKIIWTDVAILDLKNIRSYILKDSESYWQVLSHAIFNSLDQLENFPKSGRIVPEFQESNTREVLVGKTSACNNQ